MVVSNLKTKIVHNDLISLKSSQFNTIRKKKIFSNYIYNKFLGVLVKKGKKSKVKKILDTVLVNVSKKTKKSINHILYAIIYNLSTRIEIKKVKLRRGSFFVPFLISHSRQIYLILKWIVISIQNDKRKVSTIKKLSLEIFRIITKLPSGSLNAKNFNNSQAYLNRSNTHFRW
jgi:ribosomal protein S7